MVHSRLKRQERSDTRSERNDGGGVDTWSARSADRRAIALVGVVAGGTEDVAGEGSIALGCQVVPEVELVTEERAVGETQRIGRGGLKLNIGR